jgi:4-alpha-glucanotransferase
MFVRVLIKGLINSPARTVILPIQDWLLTTDRINIPGTEKEVNDPNWHYRVGMPVDKLPIV